MFIRKIGLGILSFSSFLCLHSELKLTPSSRNIVAQEIMGEWVLSETVSKMICPERKLKGKQSNLKFEEDEESKKKIFEQIEKLLAMDVDATYLVEKKKNPKSAAWFRDYRGNLQVAFKKIYSAGRFTRNGKSQPFVLANFCGNPHVFCLRGKNSHTGSYGFRSFNIMIAANKKPASPMHDYGQSRDNDILFIDNGPRGQDLENTSFWAYTRLKKKVKTKSEK